jgi:hypothetical protein
MRRRAAMAEGAQFGVELLERARILSAQLAQGSVAECLTAEAVDQQPVTGSYPGETRIW